MNKALLALTLALSVLPVAAVAQNAPPPALTDQQRQAMFQTFKTLHTQEETLHKQFRTSALRSLTPIHRQTVANLIGQLAVSENPDKRVTAQQIDALLGGAEKNAILSAHTTYLTQSKTLHQQAMQQMQQFLPAGGPQPGEHRPDANGTKGRHVESNDPGEILLRALTGDEHGGFRPMGPPMGAPQH